MDKYPYRRHLYKTALGTADTINDDPVPKGHMLTVHHISVENQTNASTRLVVGISNGNNFDQLIEEDTPAADNLYWHDRPIFVPEGWFIRVYLTGATASDVLQVYVNGLMEKVG